MPVTHLECTRCGKRREAGGIHNLCECGGPLYARYDLERAAHEMRPGHLALRQPTLWRYHELLPVEEMAHQIEIQNLMARINLPMSRVEVRTDDGGHPMDVEIANLTLKHLLLLRFYADADFARAFRYDREDIARARRNEDEAARHGLPRRETTQHDQGRYGEDRADGPEEPEAEPQDTADRHEQRSHRDPPLPGVVDGAAAHVMVRGARFQGSLARSMPMARPIGRAPRARLFRLGERFASRRSRAHLIYEMRSSGAGRASRSASCSDRGSCA